MFNDRLRAARIGRGYTLQKTADALNIALRTYQKYESGDNEPSFSMLVSIADFLDVPTDFLLGRDDYLLSCRVTVDISPEAPPRRGKAKSKQK